MRRVEAQGGDWYRYTTVGDTDGAGALAITLDVGIQPATARDRRVRLSYTGVASEGVDIAHLQLEAAATPGPQIRTTGAAASSVQSIYYLTDADLLTALDSPRIGIRARFSPTWDAPAAKGCILEVYRGAGADTCAVRVLVGPTTLEVLTNTAGFTSVVEPSLLTPLVGGGLYQLVLRIDQRTGAGMVALGRCDVVTPVVERTTFAAGYSGTSITKPTRVYLLTDSSGAQPLDAALSMLEVY